MLHTNDGREYLTPQQLQREIRDELYVARGRVSLVDLASTLNVDYSHVEHQAQLLSKQVRAHIRSSPGKCGEETILLSRIPG